MATPLMSHDEQAKVIATSLLAKRTDKTLLRLLFGELREIFNRNEPSRWRIRFQCFHGSSSTRPALVRLFVWRTIPLTMTLSERDARVEWVISLLLRLLFPVPV